MSAAGAITRVSLVVLGSCVMLYGVVLTLGLGSDLTAVLLWLVGGVLVHDLVLAPLMLGAGWVMRRAGTSRTVRAGVQAFTVVAGTALLASAPTLLGREHVNDEPGLLEQDYSVGLVAVLGVALASGVVMAISRRRDERTETGAGGGS